MKQIFAQTSLIALCLFYIIMLGGGNYEQLNVTAMVTSAPPKSLYMLQGEYGFNPIKFWILFRPLTILLFLLALAANWRYSFARRRLLLIAFAIDIATTVATYTYFAPQTEVILSAGYGTDLVDDILFQKAELWKNLNWVRLGAFYVGGILLLFALAKRHESTMNA
jgi:hypothetical protein